MAIYLGLGSNQGRRKDNLQRAMAELQTNGFEITAISPMVETPALLPQRAEPAWNRPFLNCVVAGQANWPPQHGLEIAKAIESGLGRAQSKRWSPRPIDIDLLLWNDQVIATEQLTIPHHAVAQRAFVLTPLLHIQPDLMIPGQSKTIFELCRTIKPLPLWMGILNITPDSFSDGGAWQDRDTLIEQIDSLVAQNVQIIDIGAESTRPNAMAIDPEHEWQRLQPVLDLINQRLAGQTIRPMISVDSRHSATLEKALGHGVEMINDVSGLDDMAVQAIAKHSGCQVVAMHSICIPVDPQCLLSADRPVVRQLQDWISRKIDGWLDAGLDLNKIIFDPGIGFGKDPLQSLELLKNCDGLKQSGLRLLIGHSRKSFMANFSDKKSAHRDLETLGISLHLCQQGVEIIRVHDPVMHIRAYRAWSHIN